MFVKKLRSGLPVMLVMVGYLGLCGGMAYGQEERALSVSDLGTAPSQGWKSVVISSVRTIQSDLTVPANVCLKFENGGVCEVQEGVTLTVNGTLEAPLVRIFRGSGKVALNPGCIEKVYPQWWGAMPDDGADDTSAIQSAIDSLSSKAPQTGPAAPGGGVVFLPAGKYEISSRLTFHNGLTLEGVLFKTVLYATKYLPAMLQRPDLTPPPDGIHFNSNTRIDGVKIVSLVLDGGAQDSEVGLDLTNTNYSVIENVAVIHCKIGLLMAQLGMYNTFINVALARCDVGMECNIGTMDNNFFGGRFGALRVGLLVNNTGQLNLYGTTFDAYKETGIEVKSGDSVNLNNLWFDSVAPSSAIKISSRVAGCTIINPRFSGPTPKLIENRAKDTVIVDTSGEYPTGISLTSALRGQVVISGDTKMSVVKFATPEPDEDYSVTATVVSISGNPPHGTRMAFITEKAKEGFTVRFQEVPGQGNSVKVDWILVR